ncbi:MAG: tetratricopeptide repeat protein [Anaerolineae bacterium]
MDEPLAPPGRRGAPQIERAPLHGVPAPAEFRFYGDFFPGDPPGRKWLLRQIVRALRQGERFVVLCGAGGIGKSALAAERLVGHFPGGVFWTDGAAYLDRGLDPDAALEPFAAVLVGQLLTVALLAEWPTLSGAKTHKRAVDKPLGTDFLKLPRTAKWQTVQALARRLEAPFLWILDNADVADDEVWRMVRNLPAPSAALLTTREKPERGGQVVPIGPLRETEAAPLLWSEAVRRRAPDAPPLPRDPGTLERLAEIVRLLEGHPLALLVAAALVADDGLEEALDAVRKNPARGETARRFDFSYRRLPEPERRLLARLAAFAADVDRPTVEAIAVFPPEDGEPDPIPEPGERLRELVRRSFLALTPAPLNPLPLARLAGEEQGAGGGGESRCLLRAQEARDVLGDPERARAAVAWAGRERLNLLGAQEAAREQGMQEEAVAFAYALDDLFERSGHWDLRRRALEDGLDAARAVSLRDTAALTHNLGVLAQAQGDYPEARRLYGESLRLKEQLGDRARVAITTAQLALLEEAEGNLPRALELITRAEAAFAQLGSPYRDRARRDRERIRARLGGG